VIASHCRPNNSTDNICNGNFKGKLINDTQGFCPFLVFSNRTHIKRFDLSTRLEDVLSVPNIQSVAPVEYDILNNCLFWADFKRDIIAKQCFNDNTTEILVSNDLELVESLAYDWISHHLYFLDSKRATIEIIQTDSNSSIRMRKIILDSNVLSKPRDIAVHPTYGYLFWTDWSADNPRIGRSNLDGKDVRILFKSPEVYWPNGITIDYINNKIYWVDAKYDYIARSDFDGNDLKKILEKSDFVRHPFSISAIGNHIYWSDWHQKAIFYVDKEDTKSIHQLVGDLVAMGLRAYESSSQEGTNACTSATCRYLCIGTPNQNYSCLCPDGMEMMNDTCLCSEHIMPFTNMTCPNQKKICTSR
ncbi:hypothetical protein ILUMI_15289, partial [Ignelater luminosus]